MEQVVIAAMAVCQEYARKSQHMSLPEYELLMYEQACRTVQAFLKAVESSFLMKPQEDDDDQVTSVTGK